MSNNIEESSVTIGVKMLWTIVVSMLVASFSLAGIYFDLRNDIKDIRKDQATVDVVQNLSLETMKLNAQKMEIELENLKKQIETKQDKK